MFNSCFVLQPIEGLMLVSVRVGTGQFPHVSACKNKARRNESSITTQDPIVLQNEFFVDFSDRWYQHIAAWTVNEDVSTFAPGSQVL